MGKKDDPKDLDKIVSDLIGNVGDDRQMLVDFTKNLIQTYTGDQAVGIAEYVAKLADALTRQNQVMAGAVKALVKRPPSEGEDDESEMNELHKKIGLPFEDELDEGSN